MEKLVASSVRAASRPRVEALWCPGHSKSKLLPMMNTLLSTAVIAALACASGAWAADKPRTSNGLRVMQCTQDGVSQGLKGKALEEFVGKCIKAKTPDGGKDDSTARAEMANC